MSEAPAAAIPRVTVTINEFTRATGVPRSTLYKHFSEHTGPRVMRLGRRVLIPVEAMQEWVSQRTAEFK